MSAGDRLKELEQRLHRGRAHHRMPEVEQDALMDLMDALWPQLTVGEQAEANARAAKLAKLMLGPDLDMVDRPGRSGELPRVKRTFSDDPS